MTEPMDDEGSNKVFDIPALLVSLSDWFDSDQGLNVHQVSSLKLEEGQGHDLSCLHPPPCSVLTV